MLIGVGFARLLYPGGVPGPVTGRLPAGPSVPRQTLAPGRHSLMVYLGHQLLLIPVVWLVLLAAGVDVPRPL
jgi:uncharacterized membrane protein